MTSVELYMTDYRFNYDRELYSVTLEGIVHGKKIELTVDSGELTREERDYYGQLALESEREMAEEAEFEDRRTR